MSNRVRLKNKKAKGLRCPKCKGKEFHTESYDDGYDLHICQRCSFPMRKQRP